VENHDVENQADHVANASINPSILSLDGMPVDLLVYLALAAQGIGVASESCTLYDKIKEVINENSSAEETQKEIFEFMAKRLLELETALAESEKALIYKDGALNEKDADFAMAFDNATRTGYRFGYGDATSGIAPRPEYAFAAILPPSLSVNTGNRSGPASNVSTQRLGGGLALTANTGNRPGPTSNTF
jgi:hypothetical protein